MALIFLLVVLAVSLGINALVMTVWQWIAGRVRAGRAIDVEIRGLRAFEVRHLRRRVYWRRDGRTFRVWAVGVVVRVRER